MSAPVPIGLGAGADPLASLRGYHLPDPVGWWPPAPGWWLLLILSASILGALIWWLLRRRARMAAARQASRELSRLRHQLAIGKDTTQFTRELSKLLRRYALAVFPGHRVAALTGDEWLMFLDAHGGDGRFRHGPGRQLIDAPYRPEVTASVEQMASLVEDWIAHNRVRTT